MLIAALFFAERLRRPTADGWRDPCGSSGRDSRGRWVRRMVRRIHLPFPSISDLTLDREKWLNTKSAPTNADKRKDPVIIESVLVGHRTTTPRIDVMPPNNSHRHAARKPTTTRITPTNANPDLNPSALKLSKGTGYFDMKSANMPATNARLTILVNHRKHLANVDTVIV